MIIGQSSSRERGFFGRSAQNDKGRRIQNYSNVGTDLQVCPERTGLKTCPYIWLFCHYERTPSEWQWRRTCNDKRCCKTFPLLLLWMLLGYRLDGHQDLLHLRRCHPWVDGVADHHDWSQSTAANAGYPIQTELLVRSDAADLDVKLSGHSLENKLASSQVAGGAHTDLHRVLAKGCKAKQIIKSGDAVHRASRDFQKVGDGKHRLF